jgi:hypothetical protein
MSTRNMDHEPLSRNAAPPQAGETGYPWLFFSLRRSWVIGFIVALLVIGLGGAFYVWYNQPGNDTAPDSLVGLSYATLGTVFLVLAAVLYGIRRRLRRRAIGQLHASLNWHMFFAIIGLALLLMHSFGQFNPISGTYALFGMIALTVSGLVGRVLDRFMPRLIAGEVAKVLTVQGEDRVVTISQKLQAIVIDNTEEKSYGFTLNAPGSAAMPLPNYDPGPKGSPLITTKLTTPWDMAYVSLEPIQQELKREAPRQHLVADKKSTFSGAGMHGAQEQITALQDVHRAMQREQFYRYIIHYWRVFHIALALLTIGLVIWHLIFAAQLLLPRMFQ